jgi:dihydropteroate synthase
VTAAVLAGAHIVRVHAVPEMVQVVKVAEMIRRAGADDSHP